MIVAKTNSKKINIGIALPCKKSLPLNLKDRVMSRTSKYNEIATKDGINNK